jgi:alanyl-tRNA synthetase
MPVGEIGGPDSEIFYDFGEALKLHEKSPYKNEKCHPNCDCGRFLEIGNSVFIQYKKVGEGKLEELPQKNVDFGGDWKGLCCSNGTPIYIKLTCLTPDYRVEKCTNIKYEVQKRRIVLIILKRLCF